MNQFARGGSPVERQLNRIEAKLDLSFRTAASIQIRLRIIEEQMRFLMATVQDEVAKITAQTDILKSIQAAVSTLSEGNTTIADEIAALKAQIAAGGTVDFSPLDQAIADQSTVINSLATAIPANTPSPGP